MKSRQFVPVEQLTGFWMVDVVGTGRLPTSPDLYSRAVQHRLIGCVFPFHQIFDNLEEPLAFVLLRFFGLEKLRVTRRVIYHLGENARSCRRQWPTSPP